VTTNLWTVGQGLITRRLMPKTPAPSLFERKSSRTQPRDDGDGGGNGAAKTPEPPKPAPARSQQPPRKVRRKKAGRR
jgi:hypothetical protein